MRKFLVICWLLLILAGISKLFWYHEWKYSLPTPVPENYHPLQVGEHVDVARKFNLATNKPLLIHFFNPECPCSRFNVPHFKSLVKKYSEEINFAVVIINKSRSYTGSEIQDKYDFTVQALFDQSIADSCGVFPPSKAVLLMAEVGFHYRATIIKGYCINKNSNYAEMAIDSLLGLHSYPICSQCGVKAYGCRLPKCTNNC